MTFNIEPFSDRAFDLGEGPHWHPESGKLYFVDLIGGVAATIDSNKVFRLLHKTDDYITAVIPVDKDPSKFVISTSNELYSIDSDKETKCLIDRISKSQVRFNDAKCDSLGRLWIGTMGLETSPGVLTPEQGNLYLLSGDLKFEEKLKNVSLSNGICWSLDQKKMCFIDSVKRHIYTFDYDIETGNIDNKRIFVNLNDNPEFSAEELPDGMTIDCNGNLWVAMFNGGRIVNIDGQKGSVLQSIQMPTSMITSVCFGGPHLTEMYATSAKKFLDEDRKSKQPLAGYVFKITSTDKSFKGFKANYNIQMKQ